MFQAIDRSVQQCAIPEPELSGDSQHVSIRQFIPFLNTDNTDKKICYLCFTFNLKNGAFKDVKLWS